MNQMFQGWSAVSELLRQSAASQDQLSLEKGESATRLNVGQRASVRGIASRIPKNGVVIADEVGMGKTRIAVELARCVVRSGGRVAILVPPGLGYQWLSELRDGEVPDVPNTLRSLDAYLKANALFESPVVLVSHAFANWRLSSQSSAWRWALAPELYARWRERSTGRLPRGYHGDEALSNGGRCGDVAKKVLEALPKDAIHPVRQLLERFVEEVQWPRPLDPTEYSKSGDLRDWLERSAGIGLGVFDLIITDEAHRGRGVESGLSRLLENVIVRSGQARRIALTATPVELDVSQWHNTLSRLGLDAAVLAEVQEVTGQYADAAKRLQQAWRSSPEARSAYRASAARFEATLSPYILRRDKREDPDVARFHRYSGLPVNAYRKESAILVETEALSLAWRKAICAAESLSVVTRGINDPVAKRLRLTIGNGHGIAALLDQIKRTDSDQEQDQSTSESMIDAEKPADRKRQERAQWWLSVIGQALGDNGSDEPLFEHPAILRAVETIEAAVQAGEKVLVFGRFTRPLRTLTELLNAREMLQRVQRDDPWPQSKVHGGAETCEWPAVRAAHRQLRSPVPLDTLDNLLHARYERERHRRESFRDRLVSELERGWQQHLAGSYCTAMFKAFKHASDERSVSLVARAMEELLEETDATPSEYARVFCQLIEAVRDKDDADSAEEIQSGDAAEEWDEIRRSLEQEYGRPQGGFARLMYGATSQESRRMMQLAFNRSTSFPRVLVAQSLVGREGLNLHKACRIVVLLHPEWNPGVVEQQIGRVDRVDSLWCNELRAALEDGVPVAQLPRIEVRPIIFRGTYDEHNWKVLRERWSSLRAQLHGDVISTAECDEGEKALFYEMSALAPNFSPARPTQRE